MNNEFVYDEFMKKYLFIIINISIIIVVLVVVVVIVNSAVYRNISTINCREQNLMNQHDNRKKSRKFAFKIHTKFISTTNTFVINQIISQNNNNFPLFVFVLLLILFIYF